MSRVANGLRVGLLGCVLVGCVGMVLAAPAPARAAKCAELDTGPFLMDATGVWTRDGKRYDLDGKLVLELAMHLRGPIQSLSRQGALIVIEAEPDPDGDNVRFIAAFDDKGRFRWERPILDLPEGLGTQAKVFVAAGSGDVRVVLWSQGCPAGKKCTDATGEPTRALVSDTRILKLAKDGKPAGVVSLGNLPVTAAAFSSRGELALVGASASAMKIPAGPKGESISVAPHSAFYEELAQNGTPARGRTLSGASSRAVDVAFAPDGTAWIVVVGAGVARGGAVSVLGGAAPVRLSVPATPTWAVAVSVDPSGVVRGEGFTSSLPKEVTEKAGMGGPPGGLALLADGAQVFLKVDGRVAPLSAPVDLFTTRGTGAVTSVVRLAGEGGPGKFSIARGVSALAALTVGGGRLCAGFVKDGFGGPLPFGCENSARAGRYTGGLVTCVDASSRDAPPEHHGKDGAP